MSIVLDLTKKIELSLEKKGIVNPPKMEVALSVDKSGSMQDEYEDGLVAAIIDRFIVAGLKFDDNGQLDVSFYNNSLVETPTATSSDVGNYLQTKASKLKNWWGGTQIAPIIEHYGRINEVQEKKSGGIFGMFKKNTETQVLEKTMKRYVGVITDGDNTDKSDFERLIKNLDGSVYFEFIAIGMDIRPNYLTGIAKNNPYIGFTHIPYPKKISDQEFYDALINDKFVNWFSN